jgi:arabinofuranosyltransferase
MDPLQRKLGAIFLAAVAVRMLFHYATGFTADDAFITFRYAQNIAAGLGYVYNPGQHVQGTTTPLFTLLLSVAALCRIEPPVAALFISLLSSGITAVIVYRFAVSLRFTHWAWLPVIAYTLWPRSIPADTCGMETALFTMLVTASFYFQHRRQDVYAIGMATLATVTRPEGALVLGLLVVYNWWHHREKSATYILVPAMILGPWLAFSLWYFGSPVPQSVVGKLALYGRLHVGSVWGDIVYLMGWHTVAGWLMTVMAGFGTWWLHKKQNGGLLEVLWILTMLAFLAGSRTVLFFWYIAPIYPVFLLLASASVPWVFDRIRPGDRLQRPLKAAVFVGIVAVLLVGCYSPLEFYRNHQRLLESVHKAIGMYLYRNADADDIVAAEDIGYMGYYSGSRILDRDGLVSPEAVPYNRQGEYGQLILDKRPDWVVGSTSSPISGFLLDSAFLSAYSIKARFSGGDQEYVVCAEKGRSRPADSLP